MTEQRPPRDNLVRAFQPGLEYRADTSPDDGRIGTLTGHFSKFMADGKPVWYEVKSLWEGHFLERVAPGAFKKTFAENRDGIRVLFNHGQDPDIGDKPIATIDELREDGEGAYYEAGLLDGLPPLVMAGLKKKQYGASFRFRVLKEDFDNKPKVSDYNPDGLPERTIREAQVFEFGPVTFPASPAATAGVRSLTDAYAMQAFVREPERFAALLDAMRTKADITVPDGTAPADVIQTVSQALGNQEPGPSPTPADTSRAEPPPEPPAPIKPKTRQNGGSPVSRSNTVSKQPPQAVDFSVLDGYRSSAEMDAAIEERKSRVTDLDAAHPGTDLGGDQLEWDRLNAEIDELQRRKEVVETRAARIAALAVIKDVTESGDGSVPTRYTPNVIKVASDVDLTDVEAVRQRTHSESGFRAALRDNGKRLIERQSLPAGIREDVAKTHISKLIDKLDSDEAPASAAVSQQILRTGDPMYRKAFGKYLLGQSLTTQEQNKLADTQRALSLGSTGFPVVWTLDPTLVPISNFAVNPWRALASIETIAGTNEWKALTSAGITAAYAAEAAEATDNSPTLAQPDIIVERAQAYVPFSIEAQQDWSAIQDALASDLADAKDVLEATKFATGAGHGSTEPKGVLTGATNTTQTTTTGAFVVADIYKIFEALPPRFRPRAQFAANLFVIDKIRQFDTSGGSGVWVGPNSFGLQTASDAGAAGTVTSPIRIPLLGRGVYEATAMAATLATTNKILLVGDFRYFKIIDRIGMNIEVDPMVLGTNRRPTGQRAIYAYWRNSSDVMSAAAFQVLVT